MSVWAVAGQSYEPAENSTAPHWNRAVVSKPLFGHDRRWCVLDERGTLWRNSVAD